MMASPALNRYLGEEEDPFTFGRRPQRAPEHVDDIVASGASSLLSDEVGFAETAQSSLASLSSVRSRSPTVVSRTSTMSSGKSSATSTSSRAWSDAPTLNHHLLSLSFSTLSFDQNNLARCIFSGILDCDDGDDLDSFEVFRGHVLRHFGEDGPPPHALCAFCNVHFKSSDDAMHCWDRYLDHVYQHFVDGRTINDRRPDFEVYLYLRDRGFMSAGQYESTCKRLSERPPLEDFVSADWVPEDITRKRDAQKEADCSATQCIIITNRRRGQAAQRRGS